jgi:hypothetical protein
MPSNEIEIWGLGENSLKGSDVVERSKPFDLPTLECGQDIRHSHLRPYGTVEMKDRHWDGETEIYKEPRSSMALGKLHTSSDSSLLTSLCILKLLF